MVSASAKEHNNTVLYYNLQEISDNLEAKEVINLGRTTHYPLIGNSVKTTPQIDSDTSSDEIPDITKPPKRSVRNDNSLKKYSYGEILVCRNVPDGIEESPPKKGISAYVHVQHSWLFVDPLAVSRQSYHPVVKVAASLDTCTSYQIMQILHGQWLDSDVSFT